MSNIISNLTAPTVLAFSVIVIGCAVGKIRVRSLSLDLSAVLIVAVIAGGALSVFGDGFVGVGLESSMKIYSQLGTALFVAAIGLSCGGTTAKGITLKNVVIFLTGGSMVASAFACAKVVSIVDGGIDRSLLFGILCGALTSTPGLSALCEKQGIVVHQAVLGYGCAYLFGVIGTVLFVQWMTRAFAHEETDGMSDGERKGVDKGVDGLPLIGLSVVFGTLLGGVSFFGFSVGASGGILCVSILIGVVAGRMGLHINGRAVSCWRSLGLVLFFVGSGVPAGAALTAAFSLRWFAYGVLLTMTPILVGVVLARFVLKLPSLNAMAMIAGGMTSTPAIGALVRKSKVSADLSMYSFAYVGALMCMLCLIRVCA